MREQINRENKLERERIYFLFYFLNLKANKKKVTRIVYFPLLIGKETKKHKSSLEMLVTQHGLQYFTNGGERHLTT
jgi:hypothetical protein